VVEYDAQFRCDPTRTGDAPEREIARLRAALDQKDRIIAEVVEENRALKKGL
jgi:hypothetical protein